ncbi:hypothetical protein [Salinibacillus xinjiangensis]|uniref:Uncharacterized protein n=1 Tax=Salinibacillus xinjiangensis TaxID=1229268 RepID=A0A6G1X4Q7_9BACI|nr:hypothetical protein [Salinibacillus xinjiangensis]MRG85981.1 hypothetical protein [Salinibacillus xinjiangensis]
MQEKVNFWSFILSIICIVLFLIPLSGWFANSIMGIHSLTIVLIFTLSTFLLGVYGFLGVKDWKGMARSVTTIVLTLSLSVFLGFILFVGSMMS